MCVKKNQPAVGGDVTVSSQLAGGPGGGDVASLLAVAHIYIYIFICIDFFLALLGQLNHLILIHLLIDKTRRAPVVICAYVLLFSGRASRALNPNDIILIYHNYIDISRLVGY